MVHANPGLRFGLGSARAVQISGLDDSVGLILLDDLRPRPWCGNQVGGQGRKEERDGDECRSVPSLPGLDPLVMPTRHFRAGLLIVPSLRDWVGCFDNLLAHSPELELLDRQPGHLLRIAEDRAAQR